MHSILADDKARAVARASARPLCGSNTRLARAATRATRARWARTPADDHLLRLQVNIKALICTRAG